MILKHFGVEEWMTEHEQSARYNLTDTCVQPLTWNELNDFTHIDLSSICLDYGEITGSLPLKEAILSLYKTGDISHITTANGCLEANALVLETLLEKDDHVICFVPGYQQFYDYPESFGCEVTKIELKEEQNWIPDLDLVKKAIRPETTLLILNNPNNPTGTYYDKELLLGLVEICKEHDIWIFADEVYLDLDNCPSISDLYDKGISTGSISKLYGLAGIRLGWIKAEPSLIERINSRRDYTMVSTGPMKDAIGAAVLSNREPILKRANDIIERNKQFLSTWVKDNPYFDVVIPKYGTVCFLKYNFEFDSVELANQLLDEIGVFFVPGACFDYENHFRLGLGQSEKMFAAGLNALSKWTTNRLAK